MDDIKTYTLGIIEVQENGLIYNREGRLIGKLLDDVDFEGEHVRGASLQAANTPTEVRTNGDASAIASLLAEGK